MVDQVVQHQQLQQVAMAMHHLLITKIYTLLVNVHGYVFNRRAQAGSPIAHIGQTLSIGLVTQLMMVTSKQHTISWFNYAKAHLVHMVMLLMLNVSMVMVVS